MKKKTLKKIISYTVFITLLLSVVNTYAQEIDPLSVVSNPSPTGVSKLFEVGNIILSVLQAVGAGVAVIATLVLGMKYMYSAPEDKATIKKQLIPYIIGGVLIFGATTLVKWAETLSGELL